MRKIMAATFMLCTWVQPLQSQSHFEDRSVGPKPIEPDYWVKSDDYPREALRDDLEGAVRFIMAVDETGKVYRCDVTISSGVRSLDNQACMLMRANGHFEPAKDQAGKVVPSEFARRLVWRLPLSGGSIKPESNYDAILVVQKLPKDRRYLEIKIREIVDADGRRKHCALDQESGVASVDRQACGIVGSEAAVPALKDRDGKPIRGLRTRSVLFVQQDSKK